MAHKVILPPKKNYIPQFLKQRDINSYSRVLYIICTRRVPFVMYYGMHLVYHKNVYTKCTRPVTKTSY